MYLARFSGGNSGFVAAAFRWPAEGGVLAPCSWSRLLAKESWVDLAIRVVTEASDSYVVLFLTADIKSETNLQERCETLLQTEKPLGLTTPDAATEFDQLVGQLPSYQLRVSYDGYQNSGRPLACDFRLYPIVAGRANQTASLYQVHLAAYRPDSEVERRVRKYLAWLDVEKPFTDPVRAMQRLLAQRLLQRGALACEYLAVQDRDDLEYWLGEIAVQFNETIGRIGFAEAPIETGDFTDWLSSGRHPLRETPGTNNIPCEAATVLSEQEIALLFSTRLTPSRKNNEPRDTAPKLADLFISYASGDSAFAFAACAQLEQKGLSCWIAPRDIDRDILPYPEAITRALAQARAVVVFVSATANLSVHIPRELDLALERKLLIVPVRLQEVTPAGQLNYLLRTCQWLNAYGRDFREAIDELVTRLGKFVG